MRTASTTSNLGVESFASEVTAALRSLLTHPVVKTLSDAFVGEELYLVGGPVREALMGKTDFADLDFTTNLTPEQMRPRLAKLGKVWEAGAAFGTLAVSVRGEKVEVTTFRTEVYDSTSRKPTVGYGKDLVTDLMRRDLTVNAIALNLITGVIIDPFNGVADLAANVLDTPDDPNKTYSEDPLRLLRLVRFSAKMGATLAPRLLPAVAATKGRLEIVSAERKLAELDKLSTYGMTKFISGMRLAEGLGLLQDFIPTGRGISTLVSPENLDTPNDVISALLADASPEDLSAVFKAMTLSNDRSKYVKDTISLAHELRNPESKPAARRVLRGNTDAQVQSAAKLNEALGVAQPLFGLCTALTSTEPNVRRAVPVSGATLMERGFKGPDIGRLLRMQENYILENGEISQAEAEDLFLS